MLKILVVTKNNPVEAMITTRQLYQAFGEMRSDIFIGSPQFTAWQVSEVQSIDYKDAYYPALRAYKKIDSMTDESVNVCIIVGTADKKDFFDYNAIIGLKNKEIQDYVDFPEEMNTTKMEVLKLENCEIQFNTIEEVIHFIKVVISNYDKQEAKHE